MLSRSGSLDAGCSSESTPRCDLGVFAQRRGTNQTCFFQGGRCQGNKTHKGPLRGKIGVVAKPQTNLPQRCADTTPCEGALLPVLRTRTTS